MKNNLKLLAFMAFVFWTTSCSFDGGFDDAAPHASKQPADAATYGISVGGSSFGSAGAQDAQAQAQSSQAQAQAQTQTQIAPETRAEYVGAEYRWSPNDKVGFYMVKTEGSGPGAVYTPHVVNTPLVNVEHETKVSAEFDGALTRQEINRIDPAAKYTYYAYYPYNAASNSFPIASFDIPSVMNNVVPNVFPVGYTFMVAEPVTTPDGEKPLTWQVDGQQHYGENIGLRYKHVFAYLEVYLSLNLMSQPVGQIRVTCTDGDAMSGTANIDVTTGGITFADDASRSNSITVNIAGSGMDIRSATDYDKIYIPINPALAGKNFTFEFISKTDARNIATLTASGAMQAGKIHKKGFKLPFYINFTDLTTRDDSYELKALSHRGYDFWLWRINTKKESEYFNGAVISAGNHDWNLLNECRGQIRTGALNMNNTLGLTNITVNVEYTSSANAPNTNAETREVRYGFSASDKVSFAVSDFSGEHRIATNVKRLYTASGVMSSSKPSLVLEPRTWGAYWVYIQEIKVTAQ